MLYDLVAPAKLNLFLHVVGRRSDGYHLIQTVFRLIDLADLLDIDTRSDGQIVRETDMLGVAHDDDLVVRAAKALQQYTGTKLGAQIRLRKHIPSGAGLGGGSSDAATVLIALNRLWRTGLSRQALMQLGLSLGADVPVFIYGQNAFAEGIGEKLTTVELPEQAYLVVQPAQHVPTQGIFQDPDLTRNTDPVKILDFSGRQIAGCESTADLGFGRNDLQPVVLKRYPVVQQALDWLNKAEFSVGGFEARMTGSGACLFINFPDATQAELARQKLLAKISSDFSDTATADMFNPIQSILLCKGLNVHPLQDWVDS
ncbi:4-(cytidine 5'-diphospho)-2-C-methyl-D-erythritol kinase [Alcaligenaceae bacterium LF4-65]|uniref:4-diphosphocytidyl-2-C-methyl-D-erythritol kinase n=1 Tax=Zwartia hollandica TaxID=324606 RepID=A0A953T6A1_9BURK|nr:4-(cytidine 5'-diphospho)-2-C-methyl-D-erythritol kinase [Zwartia hollandica]MBZ1349609.1 4-(cytidine 5'-diphospho)-2-C-methyl-D-erythritol kinase [Zwartia hollandica]